MRRRWLSGALAAGVAGTAALRRRRSSRASGEPGGRWLVVTVNRPPDEVAGGGGLPDQLVALGDSVEVQVRPAPGGRGTELAARPRTEPRRSRFRRAAGRDPRQDVRRALREAKQVLEAGEVVRANEPGTTKRTLLGIPIDLATRRAGGEGRL